MKRLFVLLFLSTAALGQTISLEPVVSGLDHPVSIAHTADTRLFVVEQPGRIVIVDGTHVLPEPFLDIRSLVQYGGEQGLLGIAFDPDYAHNGFFYIDYTSRAGNGDTVIARYSVSSTDANRADAASARTLLTIDQPFANHNGGQLQFGPDGYLYIGMGDGGSGGDPGNRAQNLGELLGKLLRLDVRNTSGYTVPASNPFVGRAGARGEIWAYGLRNPWRFSFDRVTGDLWIADVGQGDWEEIDFQPAASIGGENYGWRRMEGTHCFNPSTNCQDASFVMPVLEYGHDDGACSITGGYVYRGARYPRLQGTYIYGDYCNGRIDGATRLSDGSVRAFNLLETTLAISTFGEDVAGELYVADYDAGRLYHIASETGVGPRRRGVRH
jgi:glucose/arabinose dehydrogenase